MTSTITIAIGRTIGAPCSCGDIGTSLVDFHWQDFRGRIRDIIARVHGDLHADTVGGGTDEHGLPEETAVFIATIADRDLDFVRELLAIEASIYGQRCIALAAGATTFVEAS